MDIIAVKFLKCRDNALLPTYGTEESAGADIYSANEENIVIKPNETVLIPTGFKTAIEKGFCAQVYPRSGLASKQGLRLANCVAIIDSDYRGEWFVPLHNDSNEEREIEPQTRIAQMILARVPKINFIEVDTLDETVRGEGGFSSTGIH